MFHLAGLKRLSSGRHRGISVDGRHLRHAGMLNKNVNRVGRTVSPKNKDNPLTFLVCMSYLAD
jgi:hypothetical protein